MSARHWERGWRLGPKPLDFLRSLRCALVGHHWHINTRGTQRSCGKCWIVQNAAGGAA